MKANVLTCVVLTLFLTPSSVFAGYEPPINSDTEQFKTTEELEKLIRNQENTLRKSFYLILNSHEAGMAQRTALRYRELQQKSPKSSTIKAEYAFSHSVALASFVYDKPTAEQKRLRSELIKYVDEAEVCRKESSASLSKSPEVSLMMAMHHYTMSRLPQAKLAAERAVMLDPKWGYAHYWLGRNFVRATAGKVGPKERSLLTRALSEFKLAETLEPSIKEGNILYGYIHVYTGLGQYDKALEYINRRLEVNARTNGTDLERKALLEWKKTAQAKMKQ